MIENPTLKDVQGLLLFCASKADNEKASERFQLAARVVMDTRKLIRAAPGSAPALVDLLALCGEDK